MSFTIQLKRSSVAGHSPALSGNSSLAYGELSINTSDQLLYFVSNSTGSNTIVCIGAQPPSANSLTTPRTITLTGDITGSVSFSGNTNVSIATTLATAPFSTGSTSGYQKMPSGIIMQFGKGVLSAGSNVVSYPISFPTACTAFTASATGTAAASQTPLFANTAGTSQTTVYSSSSAGYTFTWFCVGY